MLNRLSLRLQASSSQELLIDSLDILAEVFTRFSATVAQSPPLQKIALSNLLQALGHSRPAVRKRALTALGMEQRLGRSPQPQVAILTSSVWVLLISCRRTRRMFVV